MNRVGIVLALMAILWLGGSAHAQQAMPAGDAAQGKKDIVTYYCFSCHGYSAEGSDQGPRIDTNKWTQANFMAYVRKGGRSMPRFATEKQIPDAALANIYAFLKARPANPDPKSVPLLSDK
jgi:mono/diheme cytochrome c family protein